MCQGDLKLGILRIPPQPQRRAPGQAWPMLPITGPGLTQPQGWGGHLTLVSGGGGGSGKHSEFLPAPPAVGLPLALLSPPPRDVMMSPTGQGSWDGPSR